MLYNIRLYTIFLGSNNPKFTRKYVQLGDVINNINNDICASDVNDKIDKSMTADPNISYNIIHDVLEKTKNTHTTSKLMKYNKYKHKKSKWITRGLLRSIRFRDNLYLPFCLSWSPRLVPQTSDNSVTSVHG